MVVKAGDSRKFTSKYRGPFRIIKTYDNKTVDISDNSYNIQRVHVNRLKPLFETMLWHDEPCPKIENTSNVIDPRFKSTGTQATDLLAEREGKEIFHGSVANSSDEWESLSEEDDVQPECGLARDYDRLVRTEGANLKKRHSQQALATPSLRLEKRCQIAPRKKSIVFSPSLSPPPLLVLTDSSPLYNAPDHPSHPPPAQSPPPFHSPFSHSTRLKRSSGLTTVADHLKKEKGLKEKYRKNTQSKRISAAPIFREKRIRQKPIRYRDGADAAQLD